MIDQLHLAFLEQPTGSAALDADLRYIRELNWAETSVGPISSWAPELLVLINLAMLSPQPQLFLLGPDSIILYNTAYGILLRDHHPLYQGRPMSLNTALIAQASAIDRIVEHAETKNKPANENRVPFFFLNAGILEEVFLSATMIQLPQSLGGFHATTYDTTTDAVQARRNRLLDRIVTDTTLTTDLSGLWSALLASISAVEDEFGFAVLYRAHTELEQDKQTQTMHRKISSHLFHLDGTVGCFASSLATLVETTINHPWNAALREAVTGRTPIFVTAKDGSLPEAFCQASRQRCYGDDSTDAVIMPSILGDEGAVQGLLILGLNPRRPLDVAQHSWIRTLHRNIANIVASKTIAEDEMLARENDSRRNTLQREILARELGLKQREAILATDKIHTMLRITQSANVGIFECQCDGDIVQTNEAFSTMSGCVDVYQNRHNILNLCSTDSVETVRRCWNNLVNGQPQTFTMNLQHKELGSIWVQAACVPVLNDAGITQSITGCATDITAQKTAEQDAIRRAETLEQLRQSEARLLKDAIEAKRQQENFVDMTSHEIRNPLSAIFHCADAIYQALADMKATLNPTDTPCADDQDHNSRTARLQITHCELLENINTISACALHQKRITDDILSLSKLDSNLLEICPSVFNAKNFLSHVHSTFSPEALSVHVDLKMVHDESMTEYATPWIRADPGRIMQVIVNLVSNGIKFTKGQEGARALTVLMGASPLASTDFMDGLVIPTNSKPKRIENRHSECFNLWFRISDTGCGMDAAGRARMFSRFSQASPKTYSTYGGSGLGLFISKMLVNLQGGEIGFVSEENAGSIFAFYVEASRAVDPKPDSTKFRADQPMATADPQAVKPHATGSLGLNVLLVEDNLINQRVLAKQLARHGYVVQTANDGREAMEVVQASRLWKDSHVVGEKRPLIDIILMDIEMPHVDGWECTRMIRAAERRGDINKHIPIIAVTANARTEQLQMARDVGADDTMSKPFHVDDLVRMITGLVGHSES